MNVINFIREGLYYQGIPVYETDIPSIYNILATINQSQAALHAFPDLYKEIPLTIFDKGLLVR